MSEEDTSVELYFSYSKVGNVDGLEEFSKMDINKTDDLGNTALHWACSGNHLDCVKYIVEKRKGKVNLKNKNGDTPLHTASWKGSLSCVQYLLESTDADLNAKNQDNKRPVDLARHLEVKSCLQSFEGGNDVEDKEGGASDNE